MRLLGIFHKALQGYKISINKRAGIYSAESSNPQGTLRFGTVGGSFAKGNENNMAIFSILSLMQQKRQNQQYLNQPETYK